MFNVAVVTVIDAGGENEKSRTLCSANTDQQGVGIVLGHVEHKGWKDINVVIKAEDEGDDRAFGADLQALLDENF